MLGVVNNTQPIVDKLNPDNFLGDQEWCKNTHPKVGKLKLNSCLGNQDWCKNTQLGVGALGLDSCLVRARKAKLGLVRLTRKPGIVLILVVTKNGYLS